MTALYLETSALLAWLLGQPGGDAIRSEVDAADVVVTSAVTSVEVERVLTRALAAGTIREADARRARGALARARAAWIIMASTDDVAARAGTAFPVEPVRTLDAIHLATALRFTEAFPDLRLSSLDRRVADNAAALGIGG
jgi:predicted nucleic acid-binding protein